MIPAISRVRGVQRTAETLLQAILASVIRSLQLALDASQYAEVAARYAAFLGRRLGLPVRALHVLDSRVVSAPGWSEVGTDELSTPAAGFDEGVLGVLRERGAEVLEGTRGLLEGAGVGVQTELLAGVPGNEILRAVRAGDLLVLGKRGETTQGENRPALGGVMERVVRHAQGPVLVTPRAFLEPRRVLLGFDGSARAGHVLEYAAELATRLRLPLLAVSVHARKEVAEENLDVVRAQAQGLTLETQVGRGDPSRVILDAARGGDLLAIGAFGEGRLLEFFRGSTTEAILRGSEHPVLLHT